MARGATQNRAPRSSTKTAYSAADQVLSILSHYRAASIAVVAILLAAYFEIRNTTYLTSAEMSIILRDTGRVGMIAVGEVLVMITGEIDVSVGSTFSLCPFLMVWMSSNWGLPLWLTALVALAVGILVGLINGLITVKLRIPSLITTLGTLFLLGGVAVTVANSTPMDIPTQEPFNKIFGENLYGPNDSFWSFIAVTGYTPFLWALGVALVVSLLLSRTTFGLHTISTGSNLLGAREIGVRTDRIKVYTFMIVGGLAAFSGIINTAQYGSANPLAGSGNLVLLSIAAAVIGGTSLSGGSGTAIGALIGAFVIGTLNNGLTLLGAQATESDMYLGSAIIAAMILNVWVSSARIKGRR